MTQSVREHLVQLAPYSKVTAFVLKYGTSFTGQLLPKKYRRGTLRLCFKNSALLSLRHGLTYVEGFASPSLQLAPTLHAWCIDSKGAVIDRTWAFTGHNSYFGVPISNAYLEAMYKKAGCYGVLDLWQYDYPICTEMPERFLFNLPPKN
jgi:hypothetical protein